MLLHLNDISCLFSLSYGSLVSYPREIIPMERKNRLIEMVKGRLCKKKKESDAIANLVYCPDKLWKIKGIMETYYDYS